MACNEPLHSAFYNIAQSEEAVQLLSWTQNCGLVRIEPPRPNQGPGGLYDLCTLVPYTRIPTGEHVHSTIPSVLDLAFAKNCEASASRLWHESFSDHAWMCLRVQRKAPQAARPKTHWHGSSTEADVSVHLGSIDLSNVPRDAANLTHVCLELQQRFECATPAAQRRRVRLPSAVRDLCARAKSASLRENVRSCMDEPGKPKQHVPKRKQASCVPRS